MTIDCTDESRLPLRGLIAGGAASLPRLESGSLLLDEKKIKEKGYLDLTGPVDIQHLDEKEYNLYKNDPGAFTFSPEKSHTVVVPTLARDIIPAPFEGHIIYRLQINIPSPLTRPLSLVIETIEGPDNLFINGKPAGKTGQPRNRSAVYYDRKRIYPLPLNMLKSGETNTITIAAHPWGENCIGIITDEEFRIAPTSDEIKNFTLTEIKKIILISLYMIVGLYFLFLFLRDIKYREYLFFFLFTFALSGYFFLRTQTKYLVFDDFFILKKIEYVLLFLTIPLATIFVRFFFQSVGTVMEKLLRILVYLDIALIAGLTAIPLFSGDFNLWSSSLGYLFAAWIIPVGYIIYLVLREVTRYFIKITHRSDIEGSDWIQKTEKKRNLTTQRWSKLISPFPAFLRKSLGLQHRPFTEIVRTATPESLYIFAGIFLMLGAMVNDAMISEFSREGQRIMPYATLIFILGIAAIMVQRVHNLNRSVETLNRDLHHSIEISQKRSEYLEGMITAIYETTGELAEISHEMKNIGDRFSLISHEQVTSSEEMAAAFEELTSSTESISNSASEQASEGKNTKQLVEVLKETQEYVRQMSATVLEKIGHISESKEDTISNLQRMIDKMQIINLGGKTISDFITMIDDITEKINLLSLNAAIEAARAGEHGRGFAVVADEISKLASATADNSREITTQIASITRDISEGMELVEITRKSNDNVFTLLDEINASIDAVEQIMDNHAAAIENVVKQSGIIDSLSSGIARSTEEQRTSMMESTKNVERLAEMAQEVHLSGKKINDFTSRIKNKSESLIALIKETEE